MPFDLLFAEGSQDQSHQSFWQPEELSAAVRACSDQNFYLLILVVLARQDHFAIVDYLDLVMAERQQTAVNCVARFVLFLLGLLA